MYVAFCTFFCYSRRWGGSLDLDCRSGDKQTDIQTNGQTDTHRHDRKSGQIEAAVYLPTAGSRTIKEIVMQLLDQRIVCIYRRTKQTFTWKAIMLHVTWVGGWGYERSTLNACGLGT